MDSLFSTLDYDYYLSILPSRERNILELRSFGYTLQEIVNNQNCSKERVRQIESKTLLKLRHPSKY
jgi:RNA polymerase sigma factor (sigma-70 family)